MKPNIREIVAAHSLLVRMYIEAFKTLKANLAAGLNIELRHDTPSTCAAEPYDVALGVDAMAQAVRAGGVLKVSNLHNSTLYERGGNEWFRTVHDMVHLLYGLGFSPNDEDKVHRFLWRYLSATQAWWSLSDDQKLVVAAVYQADTYAQTKYERRTGSFPEDQGAFVIKHVQRRLRNATA